MNIFSRFTRSQKIIIGTVLGAVVIAVVIVSGGVNRFLPGEGYEEIYTLVPDTISTNAAVPVSLPAGVTLESKDAPSAISFTPALAGEWVVSGKANRLVYEPAMPLPLGSLYTVSLTLPDGKLEKSFKVEEDPKVLAIFPKAEAEAPETSAISIVFNRPMIPLTTLDEKEKRAIPVTISPNTPGTFKWISTRILQFVPETRLLRSQKYTVSLQKGLVSLDGLEVPPADHTFTTRALRYAGATIHHEGTTVHSEPILVRFNQPVDLLKTKGLITVANTNTRQNAPIILEYGTRRVRNQETGKDEEFIDKSVLAIVSEKDSHGRARLWDAETVYTVIVQGGVGLEGNITLSEDRSVVVSVPSYIAGLSATSPRSRAVSPDMFDPQGRLIVEFYEDIDKDKSSISAPGLSKIEYDEKCKPDPNANQYDYYRYYRSNDCEKVPDQSKLLLSFERAKFSPGQEFSIEFKKLVDSRGITINPTTITRVAKVYPSLQITKTFPNQNGTGASVREMVVCSTTPLTPPKEEEFYTKVTANAQIGKWNWRSPQRVDAESAKYRKCALGEFENTIHYSLIPEKAYSLSMDLKDDFGQTASEKVSFVTEKLGSLYRSLRALQKEYNVTSPDKTKLTYAAENLEYVNLHVCQISPTTMLNYLGGYGRKPSSELPGESLPCVKTFTKRIDLPINYWSQNYFQIDLKTVVGAGAVGHYVVTLSHPELRGERYDYEARKSVPGSLLYPHTYVTLTRLAVGEKNINLYDNEAALGSNLLKKTGGNLYWVSEIGTLAPVAGATVDVYTELYSTDNSSRGRIEQATRGGTDSQGIARTEVVTRPFGAIITSGADSAIVSASYDKFAWGSGDAPAARTYLYTDRPIYRPGQEVFFKGLTRLGYDGDYEVWRKPVNAIAFGPQGESLATKQLDVSEYGTFSSSFKLPENAALGTYRIEGASGYAYFSVEEYAPAAFKAEAQTTKPEYIAGDTLSFNLSADYYFGVPVEKGEVEYSIVAQDYYFDRYQDEYFSFGGGWYYSPYSSYGDTFIARGKAFLDANGKTTISQQLDFDKLFKNEARNKGKIFVLKATIKNATGQAISTEKSVIVHRSDTYLGVNLDKPYFAKGDTTTIRAKTVDTQGKPKAVSPVDGEIYRITWDYFKRQEVDGRFYYTSEEKKELVKSFRLSTDGNGNASYAYKPDKEGEYRVILKSGVQETSTYFYVYGAGTVDIRPANNESLDLVVPKNSLSVGEEGSFVVKSPYQKAKALITLERGSIFDYKIVDINQNLFNYSFKVEEKHGPNVYASVLLLSPDPEIKYGQVAYQVNLKEKELSISIKSNKNNYLPGEEVTLSVETRNSKGQLVPAEVSLAVADLSVLALKGNPKKNPVAFFYAGLPLAVTTASNIKNVLEEAEIPTGTKGGGGGALEPTDLAKKKRGVFKDTAFWRGELRTGAQGTASVTFTLPDNLTTWQAEAVGITEDTKVGSAYSELIARKSLSLIPLYPRFILPGDQFTLGTKIVNDTDETQQLSIAVESTTLELGSTAQSISIGAHKTETIYFKASAPKKMESGKHAFQLSAKNSEYEDTVEGQIPVGTTAFYETTGTASFTSADSAREYIYVPDVVVAEKGGLTIRGQSSLVSYLGDAFSYLIGYPYGCTEQMASKLRALAVLKKSGVPLGTLEYAGQTYTADDLVKIGLAKIYASQDYSGGFMYYQGLKPSYSLTLEVLGALQDIRDKGGYGVDQSTIDAGARYVYSVITNKRPGHTLDPASLVLGIELLTRLDSGGWNSGGYRTFFDTEITRIVSRPGYLLDSLPNPVLSSLAVIMSRGYASSYKDTIFTALENRLSIDPRGSFLSTGVGATRLYDYYETPERNTALFLKALVAQKRESPITDQILRWLVDQQKKDGSWGTTNATVTVMDALSDYVSWKREADASYSLGVTLGEKEVASGNLSAQNKTLEAFVPIDSITKNTILPLEFSKKNTGSVPSTLYYSAQLTYALPTERLSPRDEGFAISRALYTQDDTEFKTPATSAKAGEVLKGRITITVPKDRTLVSIEDYIPAGMELVNFNLATEQGGVLDDPAGGPYQFRGQIKSGFLANVLGIGGLPELDDSAYGPKEVAERLYPDAEELHDDRVFLFKERMVPGVYVYEYYVRALVPGTYNHLPAVASQMYSPEVFGRSAGALFRIEK